VGTKNKNERRGKENGRKSKGEIKEGKRELRTKGGEKVESKMRGRRTKGGKRRM
jgi:hypothetical protein